MRHFIVAICFFLSFGLGYFVGRVSMAGAKDIARTVFVLIKAEVTGVEPTCFDFPDEIWQRMPSCVDPAPDRKYDGSGDGIFNKQDSEGESHG